jgi:hypothetical protein
LVAVKQRICCTCFDLIFENYQYRIHLSWWVFAATGVSALMITLLTVSFQSVKAAIANPVTSLRSEYALAGKASLRSE